MSNLHKLFTIAHLVVFLSIIPGCLSTGTHSQTNLGTLSERMEEYFDSFKSLSNNMEVPAKLIRNYGAYFLENQGFDINPLICEIGGVNINEKFTQISKEYTLNSLKMIISLKLMGSINLEFLSDLFQRMKSLGNINLVSDFYVEILNQIEVANLLNDKYRTHRSYLRIIESSLDNSLTSIGEIRKHISEYIDQSNSEFFCKYLYEAKFLALEQNLLIVKTVLYLLDYSDPSKFEDMFRGKSKDLYNIIANDKEYLSSYYLADFGSDVGDSLLECIKRSNMFVIPDSIGPLKVEISKKLPNGSIFGKLLNEMANDGDLAFGMCKVKIEKLLKEIELAKQRLISNLEKANVIAKLVERQSDNGGSRRNRYKLLREYKVSGSNKDILTSGLSSLIESEEIEHVTSFISEVQRISRENMNKIVDLISGGSHEQSLGVFSVDDLRFPLSIFNKQYNYMNKLNELDEVLNSIILLSDMAMEAENRVIRLLNLIPIFHLLEISGPQDQEKILFLKTKINEYTMLKQIQEEYKFDSVLYKLDPEISEFVSTLISNMDSGLEEYSCKTMKDYYSGITNFEIRNAMKVIDNNIVKEITHYNDRNYIFTENVDSLGVVLGLNFLVGFDSVGLGKLILNLLSGELNLRIYIDSYLAVRKCIEKVEDESSLTTDSGIGLKSLTVSYIKSLNYIRNGAYLEKEVNSFDPTLDLREINDEFSMIKEVVEYSYLAKLYLSGPVIKVTSGKGGSNYKFTKREINFIYDSIMTTDNKLFKIKGLTPLLIEKKNVKEMLHFLFSIFSSYRELVSSLDKMIKKKSDEYNSKVEGEVSGFYVSEIIKTAVEELFISLKEMLNSGFVGDLVLKEVSECVNIINGLITPEYSRLFTKMYDLSNSISELISIINNGESMLSIDLFIKSVTDFSIFGTDTIVAPRVDDGRVFITSLNRSNYPGSIIVERSRIRPQESDSNCRVAFIDLDVELYKETNGGYTEIPVDKYNILTVHCIIQNSPGRTLDDFLKIRSLIKSGGILEIEGHVIDFLTENVHVTFLAVDHTLANSNVYIDDLEMELNQYFLLIPGLNIEYVVNLDVLLFSLKLSNFYNFEKIINYCLDSYMSFESINSSISRSFLRKSSYVKLLHSTNLLGNVIKLSSIGKYSGFGGETPVLFSFNNVNRGEDPNVDYLINLSRGLFQKSAFNCVTVLDNIAPLKTPSNPVNEYVWVLTERSHISYMMLLRNALINDTISGKLRRTLYAASLDVANQVQINNMNAFFNSLIQRESNTNMFYDVTKNKLMFLVDNNFDILKSATECIASLKMYSHKNFFENVVSKKTEILNVPVFQIDMKQAVDQYVIGSMPLYCSARRNYYDNSIVLSISTELGINDIISYKLLLRTLDSSLNLRIRNLPSQNALRMIFNVGSEFIMDINNLKYTYILPISDSTDAKKISEIKDLIRTSMREVSLNSLCPSVLEFTPEISLSSIGLEIITPKVDQRLKTTPDSEIFTLNGVSYYVIRYNSSNFLNSLGKYMKELLLGRANMIFASDYTNLENDRRYLPQTGSSLLIHLIKGVPIQLVKEEHVLKIYTEKYENHDLSLIHGIMKVYKGYNVSIVTKDLEYYYIYKLCFDESNTEKECIFVNVFRYVQSNMFEKLSYYQKSLNLNQYFSVIAEENEIISEEMIGLNVITRFGGSVLFRGEDKLELYYYSNQYWDVCAFVKEYYEFSTELTIVLINDDPTVEDVVIESTFVECPTIPIHNLHKRDSIPHFVRLENLNKDGLNAYTEYVFTLYKPLNYQILASYIEFHLAGHNVALQIEGFDLFIRNKKIGDILNLFSVYVYKNAQGSENITLKGVSLTSTEIQGAKAVATKLREIYPNSQIVAVNTRDEMIEI
ncbi:hypothetical protein FG379_002077 [Cryptosporidium bovis]|uniref:uncharacterized protein n=1 Tax=Cryptosporidium bovis TaxID=310047 RepID=UPI00351A884A|nr:hypothetical protein FG379_002077 [Cryptosporidium bovis]